MFALIDVEAPASYALPPNIHGDYLVAVDDSSEFYAVSQKLPLKLAINELWDAAASGTATALVAGPEYYHGGP